MVDDRKVTRQSVALIDKIQGMTELLAEKDQKLKQKDGEWHPDLWQRAKSYLTLVLMICRRAPSCKATDLSASIIDELQAEWLHGQASTWVSEQSAPQGGGQVTIAGSAS
jgi:hypothetical protein